MVRLRTDIFVQALIRRVSATGAFATVARKGALEAGTLFIIVDRLDGRLDLYGPAPQSFFMDETEMPADRFFIPLVREGERGKIEERLVSESRFDPDLWVVEIEDREGRSFVAVADSDASSGRP
ncbi:DUF1491 family protein [Afifella sp. YEN Y35]|uniref:DUF1491 family protein n=1 Tax=Afifella sp. YEN Y35 TaxID=3388337 RepID=UPI0039E14393